MYKLILFALTLLLIALSFFGGILYGSSSYPTEKVVMKEVPVIQPTPYELNANKLWTVVNKWRTSEGLREYQKHELLCDIARSRIYQIKSDWSHDGFVPTLDRVVGNRYREISENLAKDHISEEQTLSNWLLSPSHRQNLDANYKYSCIVTDGQYAVQIFGNF